MRVYLWDLQMNSTFVSTIQIKEISETLTDVYTSLNEKGYNPINQIVKYVQVGILRTYLVITHCNQIRKYESR